MNRFFSTHKTLLSLLLIVMAVSTLFCSVACTQSQVATVVAKIAQLIPGIEAANSAVAAVVSAIDPAIAAPVLSVTAIVNAGLSELKTLCTAYGANQNATVWQSIVASVDSLVVSGDTALLNAAQIKNADSQAKTTAVIGTLDALLHVIDGWVSSAQPKAVVQARLAQRQIKLDAVVRFWSEQDKTRVAQYLDPAPTPTFAHVYREAVAFGF